MNERNPAKPPLARRTAGGKGGARLDPKVQSEIGKALRVMYDDVVKQGVPDRFADLLAKLDQKQADQEPTSE